MSQIPANGLFSLLPERRPPWKEFLFSFGVESLAIVILAWIGVLHPNLLTAPVHDYHFVQLVPTPLPVDHEPAPVRMIPAPVLRAPAPAQVARLPRQEQPELPTAPPPKVEIAEIRPVPPVETTQPVIPRKLVKTDVFSTGSSATPTIARAPQQVQTGGFGDPNGVPSRENNGKPVNVAQLGSFDLPSGQGEGNGTGSARGARGVVASAGFGDGTATGDGSGRANTSRGRGAVREGGFGDSEPAAAQVRKPATAAPRMTPAEIISKPNPLYTQEARKLRVEGEVLLEVVFESTGKLRVVRVVRGLGHGLDEAAVQAAQQIQFKPALRDGQPADSTAVLHIVFQLA
jgi:TonB family protein